MFPCVGCLDARQVRSGEGWYAMRQAKRKANLEVGTFVISYPVLEIEI